VFSSLCLFLILQLFPRVHQISLLNHLINNYPNHVYQKICEIKFIFNIFHVFIELPYRARGGPLVFSAAVDAAIDVLG